MMQCIFIWLEISFILIEQNECIIVCVLWKDECETTSKEVMKKSTHEDVMNVTMNKFEDKDECKGGGSIRKISIPMEKFTNR